MVVSNRSNGWSFMRAAGVIEFMEQRKKLGEIFIEQNLLCVKSVERVLPLAKNLHKRFGTVLKRWV
jgi:hypothetical protein